jgi:Mn2+/Fe2+ NRAMP family transporter
LRRETREFTADWLMLLSGIALLVSLFLTWSHQFSAPFLSEWSAGIALARLPHDPTAWQVYSVADVALALVAAALILAALLGRPQARLVALVAAGVGLAFCVHALSVPPTNGAELFNSPIPDSPTAGPGVTLAIAALGAAIVGLLLSFTAD